MRVSQGIGVRRGLIPGLLLAALVLAGCGGDGGRPPIPTHPPAPPQRVVCGTPAVAEIVYALGAGPRVVGVSDFTDFPPEAAAKPSIGGALSPNRERLLRLEPDLLLSQGKAEALADFAQSRRIAFLSPPLDTLADLRAAIAAFASALGAEDNGRALLAQMQTDFAALPSRPPLPVFIAVGHAPGDLAGLMTAGPGTFLHELVELAGGRNVFGDVAILWPKISQESLVRRAPALVLDFQGMPLDAPRRAALAADWQRLGFAPQQIRILEEDYLLRPGPRAPQSAARIAQALSPD